MEKPLQEQPSPPRFTGLKITVGLAFLLSLAALAGAISFYQVLNSEKRKREALEATQVQVQEKAAALENATEQYRSEIARMRQQLKGYSSERKEFQRQIEEGRQQIAGLEKKLLEMEEQNKAIEEQIKKINTAPLTESSIQKAPSALPEQSAGSLKAEPAASQAPKIPKVLTVNRRFNFVVVNLGIQDKIKLGDSLDIERDGKIVGSAKVEKLYDSFAAAAIVKEPQEDPIKEGDVVRRPA